MAVEVHNKQSHPAAFRPGKNQRLFASVTAGFPNHSVPPRPKFLSDHPIQLIAVYRSAEVLELCHMQAAYATMRGSKRHYADQPSHWNLRCMRVIAALD